MGSSAARPSANGRTTRQRSAGQAHTVKPAIRPSRRCDRCDVLERHRVPGGVKPGRFNFADQLPELGAVRLLGWGTGAGTTGRLRRGSRPARRTPNPSLGGHRPSAPPSGSEDVAVTDRRPRRGQRLPNQRCRSEVWLGITSISNPQAAPIGGGDQLLGVDKAAEDRIHVAVACDVVAAVDHRRADNGVNQIPSPPAAVDTTTGTPPRQVPDPSPSESAKLRGYTW